MISEADLSKAHEQEIALRSRAVSDLGSYQLNEWPARRPVRWLASSGLNHDAQPMAYCSIKVFVTLRSTCYRLVNSQFADKVVLHSFLQVLHKFVFKWLIHGIAH